MYNKMIDTRQNVKSLSVELMLLPSIKYDFTILRQVIMTLILLKTIHTLHHKNQKNKY